MSFRYFMQEAKRKTIRFLQHPINNTVDWAMNAYEEISLILNDWDLQLYDVWNQVLYMGKQLVKIFYIITDKIRYIIKEVRVLIAEILRGFNI